MGKLAVVTAEGVLCRREGKNPFMASQPIGPGMDLVAALDTQYSIAVASAQEDRNEVRDWLINHGMAKVFSYIVERTLLMPHDPASLLMAQVSHLRSLGYTIGLVVTADPASASAAHSGGLTSILFTHPRYARPEWRPDDPRGARSWAEIEADIERQAQLKAEDTRVSADVGDARFE